MGQGGLSCVPASRLSGIQAGRSVAAAVVCAAMLTDATRAQAVCDVIPNGSFEDGLDGWSPVPVESSSGIAFTSTSIAVVDGSPLIVPMDGHVARLGVFAGAGADLAGPGIGSANATVGISTQNVVAGRYLRFTMAGGWEALVFGDATFGYHATLNLQSEDGTPLASYEIESFDSGPGLGCENGLSILGLFDPAFPHFFVDLAGVDTPEPPVALNEVVQIEIRFGGYVTATQDCDEVEFSGAIYVDNFSYCDALPEPADLNGDLTVDGLDLALLLDSWSIPVGSPGCHRAIHCPADINNDGVVDGLDLGQLLANWG